MYAAICIVALLFAPNASATSHTRYRGPDGWRTHAHAGVDRGVGDAEALAEEARWRTYTSQVPDVPLDAIGKRFRTPSDHEYKTASAPKDGYLNVHLVPHTHDDTGWLLTVDEYYYQKVQYILDTVVQQLGSLHLLTEAGACTMRPRRTII